MWENDDRTDFQHFSKKMYWKEIWLFYLVNYTDYQIKAILSQRGKESYRGTSQASRASKKISMYAFAYMCIYIYVSIKMTSIYRYTLLIEIACAWCIIKKILCFQFSTDYLDGNYLSFFSCFEQFSFNPRKKTKKPKNRCWVFFPMKLPALLSLAR